MIPLGIREIALPALSGCLSSEDYIKNLTDKLRYRGDEKQDCECQLLIFFVPLFLTHEHFSFHLMIKV